MSAQFAMLIISLIAIPYLTIISCRPTMSKEDFLSVVQNQSKNKIDDSYFTHFIHFREIEKTQGNSNTI